MFSDPLGKGRRKPMPRGAWFEKTPVDFTDVTSPQATRADEAT
ncbi:hypothetical protein [Crateriforma conspicua]|nr:hypothetical protein [Crateriforma conspicua]